MQIPLRHRRQIQQCRLIIRMRLHCRGEILRRFTRMTPLHLGEAKTVQCLGVVRIE